MVRLTFNTPISPRHKIIFKGAMKLLSADQVKYVTKSLTHAEKNVINKEIVIHPKKLVI